MGSQRVGHDWATELKIFENFPTSPAPSAPLPPLAKGTKPKVPSIQEQEDPDDDSSEALFDTTADVTFLDDNGKPLACTRIYEKILSTHSPSRRRLSELLALQSWISKANGFSAFPVLRNTKAQGQIIPQYEGIDFSHMQQIKKAVTMCGPHLPFTKELLNVIASFVGNFVPYDWWLFIKALLKLGEYLKWTMWFQDVAQGHVSSNAWADTPRNQIPFEMLTNTGQCDAIETQIQSPPWWKTILTVIIVVILFLLFAFYICSYIMNFVSKWLTHLS